MSLLLKQSSVVSQLALYDIVGTPGVAADLSHIETQSQVCYCVYLVFIPDRAW